MMLAIYAVLVATIASFTDAHGFLTSPKPRTPGTAMAAACGQQVYSNQASDNNGNIQGMLQVATSQSDYKAASCEIWLCKGYKEADNTANVQSYTTGQVVPMTFDVRAPHTGVANVSVVDTATNTVIGQPLISWDVFASNSAPIPANETSFSVTIPDLAGKCTTAGECVIQHFWDAASINQTYESCIDFTVGGTGSSSGTASSSAGASVTAPASTSVVVASSAAVSQTSAAVISVTSAEAVPTTLATSVVAKVATSSAAASATASVTPVGEDDDDSCEA